MTGYVECIYVSTFLLFIDLFHPPYQTVIHTEWHRHSFSPDDGHIVARNM